MPNVLLYCDQGVSALSGTKLIPVLHEEFSRLGCTLRTVDAGEIRAKDWTLDCRLLIIPGGRSLPYHQSLSPEGTSSIKKFVSEGGTYLGLCAGGYFGSSHVEFDVGQSLEIIRQHDLKFFSGKAVGPAFGPGTYDYNSEAGARAALLGVADGTTFKGGRKLYAYFNGGCYFEPVEDSSSVTVLARYAELPGEPAAIIECVCGDGRAILCGPHIEYPASIHNTADPHLARVLPRLYAYDQPRLELLRWILERLVSPPC